MPHHLPPTAVPIAASDLIHALRPPADARACFQSTLARYLGVRTCKLAASGRTALYLLLKQLTRTADHAGRHEVIMPAYTCPSLAKVALDAKLHPRFVDISSRTLAFEGERLEACINEHTLAVICVHPFGIPQSTEKIQALAQAAGAVVIEDAAQSMGARLEEHLAGTQSDFGLFSLGPGKPLSTGGGGILCTNDERQAWLMGQAWRKLPDSSFTASVWAMSRLVSLWLAFHPIGWWLATRAGLHRVGDREASWGFALRGLTDVQATIGMALLDRLDAINQQRAENAGQLIAQLQELEFLHIPPPAARTRPIYLRLPVLIDDEERRERLFRRLWATGIGVGRMYRQSLPEIFPQAGIESYPGANYVARHLLTLPTHHYLTPVHIQHISEIFRAESCAPHPPPSKKRKTQRQESTCSPTA
jgi:perosamine synthetase